jgi:hypothetical protein
VEVVGERIVGGVLKVYKMSVCGLGRSNGRLVGGVYQKVNARQSL